MGRRNGLQISSERFYRLQETPRRKKNDKMDHRTMPKTTTTDTPGATETATHQQKLREKKRAKKGLEQFKKKIYYIVDKNRSKHMLNTCLLMKH